jgi:uncharacterized protein (DUF2237 family)
MLKPISAIAAMAVTIAFASITFAQCNSCGTGDVAFGYPGGTCATCSTGGGFAGRGQRGEYLKAKLEHASQYNDKVSARNQAWPKPFTCADRQVYSAMWGPMLDAGFADQTTVTSTHFEEGKLTRYGKQQIAGIMRNMPQHRKVVYVQRDSDEETTQNRYDQVQEVVSTFYGHTGRVALTDRNPINQQGLRAEATTNAYYGALPVPNIPISDSSSTVGDSVTN